MVDQKCEKTKQVLVFVFPGTVIKLEVQGTGQIALLLQQNSKEDVDGEIAVMWPQEQVKECIRTPAMNYCTSEMSF